MAKVEQAENNVPQVKQWVVTRDLIQTEPMSVSPRAFAGTIRKRTSLFSGINTYKDNRASHGKPA